MYMCYSPHKTDITRTLCIEFLRQFSLIIPHTTLTIMANFSSSHCYCKLPVSLAIPTLLRQKGQVLVVRQLIMDLQQHNTPLPKNINNEPLVGEPLPAYVR